jgi:hypothetical protein
MANTTIDQLQSLSGLNTSEVDLFLIYDASDNIEKQISVEGLRVAVGKNSIELADKIVHSGDLTTAIRFPANNVFTIETAGTERFRADASGNIGIGTATPSHVLDVNGNTIRIRTAQTPASATAGGTQGQVAWDANYIYVGIAANTWKRAALSTW